MTRLLRLPFLLGSPERTLLLRLLTAAEITRGEAVWVAWWRRQYRKRLRQLR